jgi:hypothetical protein
VHGGQWPLEGCRWLVLGPQLEKVPMGVSVRSQAKKSDGSARLGLSPASGRGGGGNTAPVTGGRPPAPRTSLDDAHGLGSPSDGQERSELWQRGSSPVGFDGSGALFSTASRGNAGKENGALCR